MSESSRPREILLSLPDQLVGERVLVRPYADEDAAGLWDAIQASKAHLAPWLTWVNEHQRLEDTLEYVRRARASWLLREDLPVAIVARETGQIVGGSGLHHVNWRINLFEIGYWLRQDAEGRGYVHETVQLLSRLAFNELGANRVQLRIDTANVRSRRVAERLGFVLEGTLRRSAPRLDGPPADMDVFALLPEEFRALPWAR